MAAATFGRVADRSSSSTSRLMNSGAWLAKQDVLVAVAAQLRSALDTVFRLSRLGELDLSTQATSARPRPQETLTHTKLGERQLT